MLIGGRGGRTGSEVIGRCGGGSFGGPVGIGAKRITVSGSGSFGANGSPPKNNGVMIGVCGVEYGAGQ